MKNNWSDLEAKKISKNYLKKGFNKDLALRVYTSRLLGNESSLVIHGGGNTSVKTKIENIYGQQIDVLCIKGSGWDLGNIEPEGLPAVKIDALKKLYSLDKLSDEEMVNIQRANLTNSNSPNPSVETLLHAFLPHKFIDHTHSNAILSLCNQPNGKKICLDIFGEKVVYVPYIMPGFDLAKKSRQCFDLSLKKYSEEPIGMILLNHGLVSFGSTAKESYSRMINLVNIAEKKISEFQKKTISKKIIKKKLLKIHQITPVIRGLIANENKQKQMTVVLNFRTGSKIVEYLNGVDLKRYSQIGTVTPDHVIRIKQKPLLLDHPLVNNLDEWKKSTKLKIQKYVQNYKKYFYRNNKFFGNTKKQLDPLPKVIYLPGIGILGVGNSSKEAVIAADLAEVNIEVISNAEKIGKFKCISEREIFEIEYWSLEQAKLGKSKEKSLQRKIVVITGGGSGIGLEIANAFCKEGSEVVILDINFKDEIKDNKVITSIKCDVTNNLSTKSAFKKICEKFGGIDILVSNAGAAWQGEIGTVSDKILRESFELNFWAHQRVSQEALKIMRSQNTGGCLLFNVSKQSINPGKYFGPYGLPKAATLFLMKQYALDYGDFGIRSNAVNADRIRSGILTDGMIKKRSNARGVSETEYLSGNLLKREVKKTDVAEAFIHLAKANKTTAAILTVDGGNIEASLR